jgi:arabinogalactan oligomer/maltooligosaccharide transport system permease protein
MTEEEAAMATAIAPLYKKKINFSRASLPYLYLAPAFIVMAVITFYPLVYQFIIAFSDFALKDLLHGLSSPTLHWIGFKNFVDIVTGGLPVQNFEFFRVLTYNFWWAITNVMVHVPAGILIAVLLNINGLWFKKI